MDMTQLGYFVITEDGRKAYKGENSMQGYVYKDPKIFLDAPTDQVCYIPEYALLDGETYVKGDHVFYIVEKENTYTRNDFMKIARETGENLGLLDVLHRAKFLFDMVDWQHPESLADEIDWDESNDAAGLWVPMEE
jgi:hypothetical protein